MKYPYRACVFPILLALALALALALCTSLQCLAPPVAIFFYLLYLTTYKNSASSLFTLSPFAKSYYLLALPYYRYALITLGS